MHRLICTFVVRIWHKTHFRMTGPIWLLLFILDSLVATCWEIYCPLGFLLVFLYFMPPSLFVFLLRLVSGAGCGIRLYIDSWSLPFHLLKGLMNQTLHAMNVMIALGGRPTAYFRFADNIVVNAEGEDPGRPSWSNHQMRMVIRRRKWWQTT